MTPALLAVVLATATQAQTLGGSSGNRAPAMRPLSPPISTPSRESVLDADQMKALREANQKHESEFRKFQEQMSKLQIEMNKLVAAPKFDEKAVREKAEALAKLQVDHMVLRARIFSETVGPTLKPAQREQLEKMDLTPGRSSTPKSSQVSPQP